VLRALGRNAESGEALRNELAASRGGDARLDRFAATLDGDLAKSAGDEGNARRLVEAMVLALQAALLLRGAPSGIAEAFCASRLGGDWGHAFGTLPDGDGLVPIVERAAPTG
jgi:putative acyl-CoA dehydrogenase